MKSLILTLVAATGVLACLNRPTVKSLLSVRRRPTQPVRRLDTARRRRS